MFFKFNSDNNGSFSFSKFNFCDKFVKFKDHCILKENYKIQILSSVSCCLGCINK